MLPPIVGLFAISATSIAVAQTYVTEAALGRALFEDKNLSLDRAVACASCHYASRAFCDGRKVSIGVAGKRGTRNAPSLLTLSVHTSFFWDGRALTLEEQAPFPFFNAAEMGFTDEIEVLARVREKSEYLAAFAHLYNKAEQSVDLADIARAIVAYERSLPQLSTSLDRYLNGDSTAISADAKVGLALFKQAGCSTCHTLTNETATFTDNAFHDSSIGLREMGSTLSSLALSVARLSLKERLVRVATDPQVAALGRFVVTLNAKDIGTFRTPSLRDVARTAPYMHDGSIVTLDEAIEREIYYRGLQQGYPVNLSLDERRKLRDFLESASVPKAASMADARLK